MSDLSAGRLRHPKNHGSSVVNYALHRENCLDLKRIEVLEGICECDSDSQLPLPAYPDSLQLLH